MLNRRFIQTIFLTVFLFAGNSMLTAAVKDSTENKKGKAGEYSLVTYVGGGMSLYRGAAGVTETAETKLTKTGFGGSIRVMWHPDHRLRLGVESGRIPFYSYTIKDNFYSGKMIVSAVPLLLEWSMPIGKRFNVFLGYGIYLLNSKLDYGGEVSSTSNSLGYVIAANYVHPISDNLGIAGEVKWMNANETNDEVVNLQVALVWKFYKW